MPASWGQLKESLKGAAVPTVTTLLAALWPDSHHILDWRVLAAVAGLGVVAGGQSDLGLAEPGGHGQACLNLDNYAKVRVLLRDIAGQHELPLSTVERALYKLSTTVHGKGKTWEQYGAALHHNLGRSPSGTPGDDGSSDDEEDRGPSAP